MIYLDHNATTPMHPEVRDAMAPYQAGAFGNPSSGHARGRAALRAVEQAREQVASLIHAAPEEIVFVSGGTEADNLALKGVARVHPQHGRRLLVSAIEHPAVLRTAAALYREGWGLEHLPVNADGQVEAEGVASRITSSVILVSVMAANNETGVVQPLPRIAAGIPDDGPCLHCDAVQAAGKIPIDVERMGVDLLSLSAHKMHGPQGVGALYVRAGTVLEPLLHGGSQEDGLRPGTHNLAGTVGFGRAAVLARRSLSEEAGYVAALRDDLEAGLPRICPAAMILGRNADRLPNTTNIVFPGRDHHALAAELDRQGIEVSTGAACSSGAGEPSHVHAAMGLSREVARGALRFSLGPENDEQDIAQTLAVLKGMLT